MNEVTENSKWQKYLLIASLCVNVLVIGAMIGSSFKPVPEAKMRGSKMDGFGAFVRALPAEKRQELRKNFENEKSGFRKNRELSNEIRTKMRNAIVAVPFDKNALIQIFAEQNRLRTQQSVVGDQVWVELIASMTDDERAEFVKNSKTRSKKQRN